MSQDVSFTFSGANPSQPSKQSRLSVPGTFSLAGPDNREPSIKSHHAGSFVSPEYEAYHEGYEQEDLPVWSLARPLPRLMRPGMRPRQTQTTQKSTENLYRTPSEQRPRTQERRPTTLDNSDSNARPQRSSSFRAHDQHNALDAVSKPHKDSTSPADLHRVATSNAQQLQQLKHDKSRQDISKHSSHDFGVDEEKKSYADNELHPSPSEDQCINAGRQRLQELADSVSHTTDALYNQPTARIDWEEFQPHQTSSVAPQQTMRRKEPEYFNTWSRYRHSLRKPFAEFLGTLIFMTIGLSASLVPHISVGNSRRDEYGSFLTTNLAWGWASMIGIYVAGGISGAHLNPAISIMLSIYRGFPWRSCWKYILAQILASFVAALIVYGVYRDAISEIENQYGSSSNNGTSISANLTTSNIFYTTPNNSVSSSTAFFSQFLAIALFTCSVLAMGDDHNAPPGAGMQAFIIGLLVFILTIAFPYNTGMCLSPARDFGPRLVVLIIWQRPSVFTERGWYWLWGCWLATISGSLVGGMCYDLLIFTGGESPLNYPTPHLKMKEKTKHWKDKITRNHPVQDESWKEGSIA